MPKAPGRKKNEVYRSRKHLTKPEVDALLNVALTRNGRHNLRDHTLILMMFRHGLRVGEAVGEKGLRWDAVMFESKDIFITREKHSDSSTHHLYEDEIVALKQLRSVSPESRYIFVSERGDVMSTDAVRRLLQRLSAIAGLTVKTHPHMLRHACGYHLVNEGHSTRMIQEWLGHRDIRQTEEYTKLSSKRFHVIKW